jgi:hypothetical protein
MPIPRPQRPTAYLGFTARRHESGHPFRGIGASARCAYRGVLLVLPVIPPPSVPVLSFAAFVVLAALPLLVPLVAWPFFLALALVTVIWVPILSLALLIALVLMPLAAVLVLPPMLVRQPYLLLILPLVMLRLPAIFARLSPPSTDRRATPRKRGPLSLNL